MNSDDNNLIQEDEEESTDEKPEVTLQDFREAILAVDDLDTLGALLEDNLEDVFLSLLFLLIIIYHLLYYRELSKSITEALVLLPVRLTGFSYS